MNWECCGETRNTLFCPCCGRRRPQHESVNTVHTLIMHLESQRNAARRRAEKAKYIVDRCAQGTTTWSRWTKLGRTWTIEAEKYNTWLLIVTHLASSEKN